eukprot:TRINITY_DN16443_c0_g1_i1.p1 TRINITY_DN16443_c0_g1~~TRINITY_DN16443_c0_g1_i1.p1  ORF type:complete len:132 (-),score=18.64 TRINITY_DN16443_c0_g1_i1:279-674(-)
MVSVLPGGRFVDPDQEQQREILPVFVHLPKASGTSVLSAIHRDLTALKLESHVRYFKNTPRYTSLAYAYNDPAVQFVAGHVGIEQLEEVFDEEEGRAFLLFTMLREPRGRYVYLSEKIVYPSRITFLYTYL